MRKTKDNKGISMKSDSTLKNINIENSETLDVEKKMSISKAIAALIVDGIYEMPYTYDELFIRIYNKEYKVADFAETDATIYYDGANDVIYLDRSLLGKEDSEIIDEFFIHEIIHSLQKFGSDNKNRIGLCCGNKGIGLNEAVIHYMASKTMKMQIERVQDDNLIYYTNNAEYYGYMIGLVIELFEFINPLITYESCISSNEKISILMSDIFADDADKVIDSFDELYKEYQNGDFKKMAEIFINTQKLMYKRFFSVNYKKAEDADQLNMVVQKMEDFAKVLAVRVSDGKEVAEDKEDFENFKSEMHKDYFQKYLEVDKQQKNTQLVVVKEGILARFFRWIKEKFNEKNSTN
jgi:hypothetical protein